MDINKKILIGAISGAVIIGGTIIGFILSQTPKKADLSTIHTEAATQAEPETMAPSGQTPSESLNSQDKEATASGIAAEIETYTSGTISIQYPVIHSTEDAAKQEQINSRLKSNALSVIKAKGIDETKDSLSIKCKIISIDPKRLTATYTGSLTTEGASQPVNLFYANTVNLIQNQDLGMNDFSDPYTMAGYVLSDDVTFSGISSDVEAEVKAYRSTLDLNTLSKLFEEGDFPLTSEAQWPESFSYEKQGTIYVSMPVPHSMGDYVLVSFNPSTK